MPTSPKRAQHPVPGPADDSPRTARLQAQALNPTHATSTQNGTSDDMLKRDAQGEFLGDDDRHYGGKAAKSSRRSSS